MKFPGGPKLLQAYFQYSHDFLPNTDITFLQTKCSTSLSIAKLLKISLNNINCHIFFSVSLFLVCILSCTQFKEAISTSAYECTKTNSVWVVTRVILKPYRSDNFATTSTIRRNARISSNLYNLHCEHCL